MTVPPHEFREPGAENYHHAGVAKGDRVIIYMPMIPEAVIAMLACARIGAIHSVVFGGFAAVALLISVVGVAGVLAFRVSSRTREFGIRMALGASSRDILNLIWLQGVRLVIAGVAIVRALWLPAR